MAGANVTVSLHLFVLLHMIRFKVISPLGQVTPYHAQILSHLSISSSIKTPRGNKFAFLGCETTDCPIADLLDSEKKFASIIINTPRF